MNRKESSLPKHPIATILAMEPKEEKILDEHRKTQVTGAFGFTPGEKPATLYQIILPSKK